MGVGATEGANPNKEQRALELADVHALVAVGHAVDADEVHPVSIADAVAERGARALRLHLPNNKMRPPNC